MGTHSYPDPPEKIFEIGLYITEHGVRPTYEQIAHIRASSEEDAMRVYNEKHGAPQYYLPRVISVKNP